jgi:16S rRNA U1498 N3-methylase RsmE
MGFTQADSKVSDFLDVLDPEVKQRLVKTKIYQRFVFERARLEKAVMKEYEQSGKLTNPEIIEQDEVVEALGMDVLDEIKNIRFILNEPTFEDFQAMRSKTKN